jgi:hypothetical protein
VSGDEAIQMLQAAAWELMRSSVIGEMMHHLPQVIAKTVGGFRGRAKSPGGKIIPG